MIACLHSVITHLRKTGKAEQAIVNSQRKSQKQDVAMIQEGEQEKKKKPVNPIVKQIASPVLKVQPGPELEIETLGTATSLMMMDLKM